MNKVVIIVLLGLSVLFLGCVSNKSSNYTVRFYMEAKGNIQEHWALPVKMPVSKLEFNIIPNPILIENDIESVSYVQLKYGNVFVFRFNSKSVDLLKSIIKNKQSDRIILMINEHPVGFKDLDYEEIERNQLMMFMEFNDGGVAEVVRKLNERIKRV